MGRLCERPGCSEPASVGYGMRAEDLVFWLDVLRADDDQTSGVLCQRHANSMVVPRHWTLDDLREPVPRLFQAPTTPAVNISRTKRRRPLPEPGIEQLALDSDAAESATAVDGRSVATTTAPEAVEPSHAVDSLDPVDTLGTADGLDTLEPGDDVTGATPWTPTFDETDDLDGLLAARSPLLARAFRGDDRPRSG